MKLGYKSLSQSEQEEAGLDLVRPWDSLLQMLSITASRDNWTALFSRRAAHLTVHEEGGARGLKGFGHFYEGGTWWEAGMPEIETNLVKTQQGLSSGGQGPFHLPDLLLPHCYLMWSTGQQEAKAKSKSTEGTWNGPTATDSLPHAGKQLSAQRLGSWAILNAELTKLLDSQDSDTLWDQWAGRVMFCWEVLITWTT